MQKRKNNEPRPKFTGSYIKKRVPQGTVLAPLLFLLFIDDTETNIDSRMRLFADDCLVHRVIMKKIRTVYSCRKIFHGLSLEKHMEDDL